MHNVVMGERIGERVIVLQGLKPGDRVIVEGVQKVRPGVTVSAELTGRAAGRRNRSMAKFFIDRPVFAIVIAIVIVLLGAVSIPNLPVASYPQVVPPVVQIVANYRGGNALDLEKTVAQPIEQQLDRARRHAVLPLAQLEQRHADHRRHLRAGHRSGSRHCQDAEQGEPGAAATASRSAARRGHGKESFVGV